MLNFSQNISRIERLTHQVTLDMEAEDYHAGQQHLDDIHIYAVAAQRQLEQFRTAKIQSDTTVEDPGP